MSALSSVADNIARREPGMTGEAFALWYWQQVEWSPGCWRWLRGHNSDGYGVVRFEGRHVPAHVAAYLLAGNVIPDGMVVAHWCEHPGCVNPGHLEAMTEAANILAGVGPPAENARKRRCIRGHDLTDPTALLDLPSARGRRLCRYCRVLDVRHRLRPRKPPPPPDWYRELIAERAAAGEVR